MPDIAAVRVDSRLIHATVTAQWTEALQANLILVANDAASRDSFRQGLMNLAAPAYAQTRFFTLDQTIRLIHKASPRQRIFLLVETLQDALRLRQGGVLFESVTLGNLPYQFGKRQISVSVYVDREDLETVRELVRLGVRLEIQRTPQTPSESPLPLLEWQDSIGMPL